MASMCGLMPGLTCCHNDLRKFQVRGKLYTLHELKGPFKKLAKVMFCTFGGVLNLPDKRSRPRMCA